MEPTISIITPGYQQVAYLPVCLASVSNQAYKAVEHIVVDGGSTDGSKEFIAEHADKLTWWCSEKDRGQSHAINKGLEHATGIVFGWINSDDLLLPDSLQVVGEHFSADPELLILTGRRLFRAEDGSETDSPLNDTSDHDALFIAPHINQQSTFYRMDAVRTVGGVDEELHYVMDLELWWRLLFTFGTEYVRSVDQALAVFRLHGESKTGRGTLPFRTETAWILKNMATQLGMHQLVEALSTGYPTGHSVRSMPLREEHRGLVDRMIVHFLLKWHNTIQEREEFEMMRLFISEWKVDPSVLSTEDRIKFVALEEQLNVPNWLAFRIKRKLQFRKA